MTLATHVRIVEPTAVRSVFDECRRLLSGQDVPYEHGEESFSSKSPPNISYRNRSGQGLHALLWVAYGADGPLSDYPAEDYEGRVPPPRASIEVVFDTAYAYRGEHGGGCADLHAWLVRELGRWLTERGLTWHWQHEYTGDWYTGPAELAVLGNAEVGTLSVAVPA